MHVHFLGIWGGYPQAGSATSSFLLEHDGFHVLVECGSGVLSRLQHVIPVHRLDALIVSHYHHDHVADIGCLQYASLIHTKLGDMERPLPIYAPAHDQRSFADLTYKPYTSGNSIHPAETRQIGPFEMSFCLTNHPAYCLAMNIRTEHACLVYTADTGWSDELVTFAEGADVLVTDCNLYNEQFGLVEGHLTAGQAGELAQAAGVQRLILTHPPHYGGHQQLTQQAQASFGGQVQIASEGLGLRLD